MTSETIIFGFIVLTSIIGVITFFNYKKSVKTLNETIDDKKVIINELVEYAEKITDTQESVKVKKPTKKAKAVKVTKPTKKVEVKPTKKVTEKVKKTKTKK